MFDARELILIDYSQLTNEELERLMEMITEELWRSEALHRELTRIRLVRASRKIKPQPPSPTEGDPEYAQWVERERE